MTLGDRVAIMRDGLLQQVQPRISTTGPQPLRRRVHRLAGDEPGRRRPHILDGACSRSRRQYAEVAAQVLVKAPRTAASRQANHPRSSPEDLEDEAFATDASPGRRLSAQVTSGRHGSRCSSTSVSPQRRCARRREGGRRRRSDRGGEAKGNVWVARVDRDTKAQEGGNMELRRGHEPPPLLRPGERRSDLLRRRASVNQHGTGGVPCALEAYRAEEQTAQPVTVEPTTSRSESRAASSKALAGRLRRRWGDVHRHGVAPTSSTTP